MSTSATDFTISDLTTTATSITEDPTTGVWTTATTSPVTFSPVTFDEPFMDPKTERLEKRVKELEAHLCDLIDIVTHLRAELYDA